MTDQRIHTMVGTDMHVFVEQGKGPVIFPHVEAAAAKEFWAGLHGRILETRVAGRMDQPGTISVVTLHG